MIPFRRRTRVGSLCIGLALSTVSAQPAAAPTFGGELAVTTDDIYHGYSETDHQAAAQLDLHLALSSGTFFGVWASSLRNDYLPYAAAHIETYIGQRFALSSDWSTSLTATNISYAGGHQYYSSDYQQLAASVAYLDRWTFSVAAIPSAVRYWYEYRVGRYAAYVAETSGQWWLTHGLYLTGGAGYYLFTGSRSGPYPQPSLGYVYGNVGLAYEWRDWRIDVGYFLTQKRVAELMPYDTANQRVAGTLSWRF
ncbi:MAG TPA: TorF family putative porin [Steroidobacteraceae bacterium]|nr:TorF family putative porin [Steroidobacteraceae bacterium]